MENIDNLKQTNSELREIANNLQQINTLKQMQFNFGTGPIIEVMGLFTELDSSLKTA